MKKITRQRIMPFLKKNMIIMLILMIVLINFAITDKNIQTVDRLVLDTTSTFITVSIIKGAADMIEGSTLFGVEAGDVVQPVLDSVEVVWKILLCALAFWGCMKLFITLSPTIPLPLPLPAILALILLILALIVFVLNKRMARFIMFCSFICSLIPFIIFGTGIIMKFCTEPLRIQAQDHFKNVATIFDMSGLEREMVEEQKAEADEEFRWYDAMAKPFKSATIIITQTKHNISFYTQKAKEILSRSNFIMSNLANGTWKYIVVLLMNSILIPGLLFLFFYKLGKSVHKEDEKQIVVQAPTPEQEPKLLTAN